MPITGCTQLRIGTSVATLLFLHDRGIEAPDSWSYTPYSVVRLAGNGELRSYGFPSAVWTWAVMDQASLNTLLGFFSADTDASVQVTISTYTDVGNRQETSNYTAYMQRPVDGDSKALTQGSGGRVMQDVSLRFTRLEAA
jgi:hypothetical protein